MQCVSTEVVSTSPGIGFDQWGFSLPMLVMAYKNNIYYKIITGGEIVLI